MKKRLLSIVLALTMVVPLCMSPYAQATTIAYRAKPTVVDAAAHHAALVSPDGNLYMWGYGFDKADFYEYPELMMRNVKSVSVGGDAWASVAAVKTDGTLWVWGNYIPLVKEMDYVVSAAVYKKDLVAIRTDGSLWAWFVGDEPKRIMENVESFSFNGDVIAAVKADGSLWTMTYKGYSSEVLGTSERYHYDPVKILDDVKSVSLSGRTAGAVKEDGSLWMWGANFHNYGADIPDSNTPVKVMDGVSAVAVDDENTAILKEDGSLWVCGYAAYGLLGKWTNRQNLYSYSPRKVLTNVVSMTMEGNRIYAVRDDNSVWGWGDNFSGTLGIGVGNGNGTYLSMGAGDLNCQFGPKQLAGYYAADCSATKFTPKCLVSFALDGGAGTTIFECNKNKTINPPNNPSRDGYFFAGWYKDEACTKAWNFDKDKVTKSCTLYAKWEPKSTTTVTAEPSTQKVEIDGKKIVLNSYVLRNDQGYPVNFVKLRDIAWLLNGTQANFNVDWRNNAIRLDARKPYTTPNGAEMTVPTVAAAPAKTSLTPVLTGGVTAPLEAFLLTDANGGGHNYFKLRDIGKVAGFNVEWDGARGIIVVTTTEDYIG